ncbi:TPA: hypothetical protein DCY43_01480 [candidate division WWE3 bacterium]|uniref:Uncharacterized protein n=3 Tax=Katanobacteria TaxID=422282 RepID=A0A0G1NFS5_UNCKA|nr:MAG: hypothetical protein UW36_C0002G0056 [candidate division WWE3 bacterium GW2011_GWA2_44_16]KKT83039.1 MAG: hypothetical protein UW82_C0049G0006 [candidate division WWE3 bacterium GW2011_GWC2_44_9]HAZ29410.1 hypothetical protein [candidate division WWE3 bacterium]
MTQSNLIKPEEIRTLAPTSTIHAATDAEKTSGGYFHPQNPDNPLPQHHTIQLTNTEQLFTPSQTLDDIKTNLEQAKPTISKNRQAIHQGGENPQWQKPFERALTIHEETHRMQEIRFNMSQLDELPKQISHHLNASDLNPTAEDACLDKMLELDTHILYANAFAEAQAYIEMLRFSLDDIKQGPEYAKFLLACSVSPALKLFEDAKPTHSGDTTQETNLHRLYNYIQQGLPVDDFEMQYIANQLGLIIVLTGNPAVIENIKTNNLPFENLQDDLLKTLAESTQTPTDFITTRTTNDLATAVDLKLMEYVTKARELGQELLTQN